MKHYKVTLAGEIVEVQEYPFTPICVDDDGIICGNPDLAKQIAGFIKKAKMM